MRMPSLVREIERAGHDDRQPVDGIFRAARQCNSALQQRRNVEVEREGAEQPACAFGKHQDQRESG
jgi:hypothetical protein